MTTENKPQKPLSIEQAGNFLKEQSKPEVMADTIKKQSKEHPISCALPGDRKQYLDYTISLLQNISETSKYAWCKIANKPPAIYTTKEVAKIFRTILSLRVYGYSHEHIAKYLHCPIEEIKKTEQLAINILKDIIAVKKNTEIPIIGGLN